MFKLVLSNVDLLKDTVPIIAEIIDEGMFTISNNGMSLVSPDRSMISVVDFKLLSSAFDEFKVEQDTSVGLNMASFATVLKRIKSTDKLIIEHGGKENKLRLTAVGNGTRKFELPLLDVKSERPPIDQLTFAGKVEMDSVIMDDGISDAAVIGDSVIIEASNDLFKMYSTDEMSSVELQMKKSDQGLLKLKADGAIKSQYSLEYLKKMIKASRIAKQMVLEFGTDYPLRMSFQVIDKLSLSFILAPRVQD